MLKKNWRAQRDWQGYVRTFTDQVNIHVVFSEDYKIAGTISKAKWSIDLLCSLSYYDGLIIAKHATIVPWWPAMDILGESQQQLYQGKPGNLEYMHTLQQRICNSRCSLLMHKLNDCESVHSLCHASITICLLTLRSVCVCVCVCVCVLADHTQFQW